MTPALVRDAYDRIQTYVRRTPVWNLPSGVFGHSGPVSLKLELFQHAGSFKTRGAFNTIVEAGNPSEVAAASGGNHGAAVAYVARELGLRARIFVPEISSPAKIALIRSFGAEIVVGGARYANAQEACDRYVAETGAFKVHPFDAASTIAGQGTVALEWAEQAELDTVLIAVGGGGLVAGMGSYWNGETGEGKNHSVRVVGVEPEGSRALDAALRAGRPVDVEVESVAADSLGARSTGSLVHALASRVVDRVVLVKDDAIQNAQRTLWREWRIAAELGGSAALAALLSRAYVATPGERMGVLICGANVDLDKLAIATA